MNILGVGVANLSYLREAAEQDASSLSSFSTNGSSNAALKYSASDTEPLDTSTEALLTKVGAVLMVPTAQRRN